MVEGVLFLTILFLTGALLWTQAQHSKEVRGMAERYSQALEGLYARQMDANTRITDRTANALIDTAQRPVAAPPPAQRQAVELPLRRPRPVSIGAPNRGAMTQEERAIAEIRSFESYGDDEPLEGEG